MSANGNVKTGKIPTRLIKTLPQLFDAAATVERDPGDTDAIGQRGVHLVAAYAASPGAAQVYAELDVEHLQRAHRKALGG